MYTHNMSTATLGGHGLGAKYALMASCYKSQNATGFFGIDYSPLNYNYHEFAHELKDAIKYLTTLDLKRVSRKQLIHLINENVKNQKLATKFINSLKHSKNEGL